MTSEEADELVDQILHIFIESDLEFNKRMTVFAKVQNLIYSEVTDWLDD